jgi:hypothetical protein
MAATYHSPTHGGHTLAGEILLLGAIVRQAAKDVRSPRAEVRLAAEQFWNDTEAVGFWADLLDLDADALRQAVQR